MSENIKAISQGNYILATQQEVSHDNSLSGNGTLTSPLGVVPGYNETVLWSGDRFWWQDTSNLQLSDSPSNYQVIRIKAKDDWELPPTYFYYPGDISAFNVVIDGIEGGSIVWKTSKFGITGDTIGFLAPYQCSINSAKTISVNTTTSFINFKEIVGINRKQ